MSVVKVWWGICYFATDFLKEKDNVTNALEWFVSIINIRKYYPKISSLLVYSPDITKEAISMIMSHQVDSVLFYKSFISSQIINSSRIKERQKTFYDINPLSSVTIYEFNRDIFKNLRQLFVFEDNKTLQTYIVLWQKVKQEA